MFPDDALKVQAFERLRAPIEMVVLPPEDGDLTINHRSELASMRAPNASAETQKGLRGDSLGGVANEDGCGDRI